MLKTGKKILCTLLVVVMCLTAAPLQGFVGLELPDLSGWFTGRVSALASSGSCGDNVTYTYDSTTKELVISGTGAMTDYGYSNSLFYNSDIKSVVIEDGVTTIGNYAFNNCRSLESVTIGNSVTFIGDDAFDGCTSLESLTIPDSVTSIGGAAFYNCTSLGSITIPDSVTSIGWYAFEDCTSLESVTIPDSVTTIGSQAFLYCTSLESITVDADNQYYSSDEYGALFNKDKTTLIQYPTGNTRTAYTIPDSVTTIGYNAFYNCKSLASVTIPDSVTSIGSEAFRNCTSLESVTIPDGVTTIGGYAFSNCTSLASVTIPDSVTSIGFDAFSNCTSLASVTIPDSVTSIGDYAFYCCTSLASVTIPDSVTSIGSGAFAYCESLESVTIGNSVTSIGWYAFYNCTSLTDVYYGGTEKQWNSINIGEENDGLFKATIHYNSSEPEQIGELKLNHSTLITRNNSSPWLEIVNYPDGVTEKDVVWSSSNERVAYIDNSIVHPIQYGKTFITVSTKDGKYSASCELTVQSSFVITSTNSSLSSIKAGEEAEYSIMLLDYEGNKLPVENVTLSNESSKYLEIVNHERTETEIKLTVKGLKAGTAVLEFGNDEPLTYNKFVFDIYPATVTYRADKVPVRDKELKTNFSRSDMFVENFRYYAVGEPAEYYMALMNVYNKNSSVGVVASYTQDGQLYDIAEVKKHQTLPTDYFEFLAVLGKGAVDIALLNTYNYRYSVESTKTEIEIKVPENGYITVSNDIKSSPINFVYGMMSVAVETAFQLAEDLTSIDSDKKSTIVKKLTKEVTDYFSKDTDHFDELVEELSKDVIKNSSKMNIVSMGNYSLDVVSAIFEAMKKKFDDVLNSALNEVLKDSAHTFIKMSMMKDFIDNKAIDKVTGGYIKAGEIMFSAAEHFNIVAEIIDLIHSAYSGETTVTFGKCNEDGFICKDTIKVNLKEEQEVLDAIYLQHYQIYIDKNQLTLRPEIKDLNLKENSVVEVHEITIMRDGVPYEIKQEVSVEIDIPDGWATFNFKIYRVEPDGKLTDMFARVANGKAYFTTDHFSEYIFVGELEENHIHTYTSSSVNPTCTENGYIKYTCVCNYSYTEKIPATGHSFAEGKSKCENCDYDRVDDCSCKCHKTGFITKLIWKITLFFNKLLRRNQLCDCGVYHY